MSGLYKEMTIGDWIDMLPEGHSARTEFDRAFVCVNAFADDIPTEVITPGLVGDMLEMLEHASVYMPHDSAFPKDAPGDRVDALLARLKPEVAAASAPVDKPMRHQMGEAPVSPAPPEPSDEA